MRVLREVEGLDGVLAEIAHVEIRVDDHLLHKDFSGLYEEMSGMGASASESHLRAVEAPSQDPKCFSRSARSLRRVSHKQTLVRARRGVVDDAML